MTNVQQVRRAAEVSQAQVTILSAQPSTEVVMVRAAGARAVHHRAERHR